MLEKTFKVLPTNDQFAWLVQQLKATRRIIALTLALQGNSSVYVPASGGSLFGQKLKSLKLLDPEVLAPLAAHVNLGMQSFSVGTLRDPAWQFQFQYRGINTGIKQYTDNGALYLPVLGDAILRLEACPYIPAYPIRSIVFKLDPKATPPTWYATLRIGMRPPKP